MKLNGANNYNVLPFYSSKEYWHSKRWYTYGQICPVAARKDYLVPFQLYFTRDVVSTSGNITLDIKRVNDNFTVKSFTLNHSFIHTPEYVIIKFPEQQITALPLGLYYYKVTYQETNDSGIAQGEALEAYSDIISIMDDESDFVRLEYWNASDIITNGYTISFADNFKFVSYIHSTIAKPDYEFEEELTKRLGYKFIETQVSTKVYKFNFLATEANCDAMRIARMCDYIKFTTSLDVYNALYMSFEVAWQDYGDVANLTVEFETDTIIQRLESFKRSDVANFYNALLYNINEPILFDYDTIAQYYSDFSGQGKMIRELDQITVNDITPASTMPIDLGQGAAKKIAIEEIFSKYSAFNEYFGFDEVNNAVYVKGNRSFYTMPLGDIIAGGYDESPGSVVKVERLTDIGDVRPDSLNANDLLKYDGTNWVTIPLASISSKIDKLTDINDVTPINLTAGDLLKYDGSKWVNIPMASISGKVEGITVNNSNYYPEPVTKLITLPDLAIPIKNMADASAAELTVGSKIAFMTAAGQDRRTTLESIFNLYSQLHGFFELDTVNNAIKVKEGRTLYTDGEIIAGGYGEGSGGAAIERLTDIGDVVTTNLATGDLLKYDGSKWVNIPMASISGKVEGITVNNSNYYPEPTTKLITLPNYPTTLPASDVYSWAKQPNKPSYSFSELSSHPTTLGGYGITDAYTKSDADRKYVLKAGDTMTGNLVFAHTSERPSYSGSIGITFREQIANGQGVKLVYNDYDNYRAPAGLILVGEQGGEYFEAPAIYQNGYKVWDAGNDGSGSGMDADLLDGYHYYSFESYHKVSIDTTGLDNNTWYPVTMGIDNSLQTRIRVQGNTYAPGSWNGREDKRMSLILDYTVNGSSWGWTSARRVINEIQDGAGAQGAHCIGGLGQLTNSSTEYVYVRGGAVYDFYVDRFTNPVLRTSTYTIQNQSVSPKTSYSGVNRTNALLTDNVASATRLQTPRTIFSKPFDGTNNVTGGAKFSNICIETDNNGNDSGRGSEINNYSAELNLQHNTSRDITMCFGGGNVRIGTGLSAYKLSVNGNVGIDGSITFRYLSGGNERNLLYQQMADNDLFRIRCGGPSNQGWVEIATADDGTEPIYVRQYTGEFASITRTLTLLDGSGNTHVPGNFYATGEVAAGSASDLRLKEIQKRPSYANRLLKMGLVRDYYYNDLAKSRDVRKVDNDLHTGMIYQDVLPVLSSMCGVDDDGYGKLNYIKPDFICTIAGATQDNTIELIKVNTRMSKLETAIRHLKRKINKLERKLSYEQASIQ